MKKFLLLPTTVFIMAIAANAQIEKKEVKYDLNSLQNEKKKMKKEIKYEKTEMKKDRKELRKLNGTEVSLASKQSFNRDFGNSTNTTWTREAYLDVVNFKNYKGKNMTAYYDYDGELVGTTSLIPFEHLPARAQKEINEKYNGYSKDAVIYFNDNKANDMDMMLYGTPFDDADNYFVELRNNNNQEIILRVDPVGFVHFFKKM